MGMLSAALNQITVPEEYQAELGEATDQLKQAIRDGVEYETAVKTGHMNDQMAVELFLVQYSAGK